MPRDISRERRCPSVACVTVPAGSVGYDVARVAALPLPTPWTQIRYLPETGSTNADLLADADGPAGEVLLTDHQTSGHGRLGRQWIAPPGSSLMVSVRLRPAIPPQRWNWLPVIAGLGLQAAVTQFAGAAAVGLKWPNDLLVNGHKAAGILVQTAGPVAVIGVGCNVSVGEAELPVPNATSLRLQGIEVDRLQLLDALLTGIGSWYQALEATGGDAERAGVAAAYRRVCLSLGQTVVVQVPGDHLRGEAIDVAEDAGLVLQTAAGRRVVHAGDVVHLRPAGP